MVIAFFESFRFMGHLWPVALLRMFTGLLFFNAGMAKLSNGFLDQPQLQQIISKWIEAGATHVSYIDFLNNWVMPHWKVFSHLVTYGEIAIGLSLIFGFLVRPSTLAAIIMSVNFILAAGEQAAEINKVLIAINSMLFMISAGRCIGLDYYFYKRVRGFWW